MPYENAILLYLTKLAEPMVVATRLKEISHQEKRWPPKKKSLVDVCPRPNHVPMTSIATK